MNSPAFKKLTYTIVAVIALSFVILFLYQLYNNKYLINRTIRTKYIENKNILNALKALEQEVLMSVAVSLGEDKQLKDILSKKDRETAFSVLSEKWKILKTDFNLSEIHIVLPDGNSFVNFIDYGGKEIKENKKYYLIDFRKDIDSSIKSGKPVSTLFICRYFVGFRAVYPVVKNGKLIAVISVGKRIENVIPVIKGELHKNSYALLKKDKLRECLKTDIFKEVENRSTPLDGYILIGITEVEDREFLFSSLDKGFAIYSKGDKEILLSMYPLKDFTGVNVGFIVLEDDVSYLLSGFKRGMYNFLFAYGVLFVGVLGSVIFFIRSLERRLSQIEELTERLSGRDFGVLKEVKDDKEYVDDIQRLKNNIIKMGKELHNYIIEMNKKVLKLSEEAFTDPMLNVLNRRAFLEIGNSEAEKVRVRGIPLSVMVLDLDNFKYINDTYGHDVGDIVLKDFVKTVKGMISTRELFFRIGGEEFVLILPGADIKKAVEIAEKIRKAVEQREIDINGRKIKYTVSIGIAQIKDKDTDIYSVLHRADKMLYVAKRSGKNRIVY
ncbi:diguanylate cyclase (GGDEF) domain-containing protein [Persephonella hydrogeniphila]|uniref:diguanylate cyclase n=1 Tax=Persephonella hydrogeniphila TaxID=198703 RepID=A0A285NF36_9AQUI|nr:diguanylate cyclase [Persephonella hydrogeniphila]SNZ06516.1 diguanylate cyclase (GGDEF) domain-containing protein [Persephonella hydrogeniphila]